MLAEARAAAIANATVRAEQYAEAAGVEVGEIVRIVEGSVSDPIVFARDGRRAEMAADVRRRRARARRTSPPTSRVVFAMA